MELCSVDGLIYHFLELEHCVRVHVTSQYFGIGHPAVHLQQEVDALDFCRTVLVLVRLTLMKKKERRKHRRVRWVSAT